MKAKLVIKIAAVAESVVLIQCIYKGCRICPIRFD